jgi:hypothetical protein
MNDDRLLLAVNELITHYEQQIKQEITEDNEVILDILQVSNLHQAEMVLHGMELGNGLDVMFYAKEALNDSETPELGTKQQELKATVKSDEEECSIVADTAEFIYKNTVEVIKTSSEVTTQFVKNRGNVYKTARANTKKGVEFLKGLTDKFNEEDEDQPDCISCKIPFNADEIFPEYEITWELRQFLKNLKSLLLDITKSLDPTVLIKDFCTWYRLLKDNALCYSSWPLIIGSFPLLISRARSRLLEIGVSWTGLVGPLIAPILGGLTKFFETLRALAVPIFNCFLNIFNTAKQTLLAIDRVAISFVNQTERVSGSFSNIINSFKSDAAKTIANTGSNTRENKGNTTAQVESSKKDSKGMSFSGRVKQPKTKIELPRLPFGERKSFSLYARGFETAYGSLNSGSPFNQSKNAGEFSSTIKGLIKGIDFVIAGVNGVKSYVLEQFDKIIFLFKSISKLIVEPLFVSAKLIGEIKVIFNLIRLVRALLRLFKDGFNKDICNDMTEENAKAITEILEDTFNEIDLEFSRNALEASEEGNLKVKAKYSDYVSRLEPVKCNPVLLNGNKNQFDIDMLYDELTRSLR